MRQPSPVRELQQGQWRRWRVPGWPERPPARWVRRKPSAARSAPLACPWPWLPWCAWAPERRGCVSLQARAPCLMVQHLCFRRLSPPILGCDLRHWPGRQTDGHCAQGYRRPPSGRSRRSLAWLGGRSCGTPPRKGESQFLLGEKPECAVTVRVDSVPKASVNGRKRGNNRTRFVIVSGVFDLLAKRKLRHRKLLLESSMGLYLQKEPFHASNAGRLSLDPSGRREA